MEGPRVKLLRDLNDFVLRDRIGSGLLNVTDFDVLEISAGHQSILFAALNERNGGTA
jgi:hypothetical protein